MLFYYSINCRDYSKRKARNSMGSAPFFIYQILYLTSSKTTLTDYQCVSTGCCTHVAKTEITIDNQHVTKLLQRYIFLPKQPKENTEKITNLLHFLIWIGYGMRKLQ